MVIFNSYVKLPEGKSPKGKAWEIHRIFRSRWSAGLESYLKIKPREMLQLPMALFTSQGEQVLDLAGAHKNRKKCHGFWKTLRSGVQNIQNHWLFGLHGFHGFSCLRMFEVYCCVEEWLGAIDLQKTCDVVPVWLLKDGSMSWRFAWFSAQLPTLVPHLHLQHIP